MRLCRDRNALLDFGRADAAVAVRNYVAELQPLTSAVRELAPGRQMNLQAGEPIARYALLVDKTKGDELREYVRAVVVPVEHVAIALLGPWPPFSFRSNLAARN